MKVTIRQAAKMTGYSVRGIRNLISKGKIMAEKATIGYRRWMLNDEQVEELKKRYENRCSKYSTGAENTSAVGMLGRGRQDPEEPGKRAECEVERP